MRIWIAVLASLACLIGASGVALAAAAAHLAGGVATTAADFLLFHAGALAALALAASVSRRPLPLCCAATLVAAGTILFSGDLALRGLAGLAPLRLMAPTGGMLMIAGWLAAAVTLPMALPSALSLASHRGLAGDGSEAAARRSPTNGNLD